MFSLSIPSLQGIRETSLYYTESNNENDVPSLLLATNLTLADLDSSGDYDGTLSVIVTDVADGDQESFEFSLNYCVMVEQTNFPTEENDYTANYILTNCSTFSAYTEVWNLMIISFLFT